MKKKILLAGIALFAATAGVAGFSAFEAHVINVTAKIENALFVHPESIEYGTVFPQEHLFSSFFITTSESFSERGQTRVGKIDYVIKQKPKPREDRIDELGGVMAARDWCHNNDPANAGDPLDLYYVNCYPNLCPYLSKTPDGVPATGVNANNDVGLPPFHDPDAQFASGKIVKLPSIGNDPADQWTVDLAVPCFEGQCAQDWAKFVEKLNPLAGDAEQYKLPQGLEHEVFGCDLWVEVTRIY